MSAATSERARPNSPRSAQDRAYERWHARGMNNDVLSAFAEYQLAARLSPTTVRNRAAILRTLVRVQGVELLEAHPRDLRRFIGRDGIAPGTARTARNAIRAFYDFAVEDGYLEASPAAKLPTVQVDRGRPRPFTYEQVVAMLRSGAYRRTRAMILIGWFQGFRVSQIARVRGDDIDMLTRTIRTLAKGEKHRRVPLHPVIAELAMHMPRGWWFPARDGGDAPVKASSVTNLITLAKKRAGILDPKLTPHSLRHGFGSELVGLGVDIRVIQELMLHEDISSTQIYTFVPEARKAAAVELLRPIEIPERSARAAWAA